MTDGNGPEVFQKCAVEWVDPRQTMTDSTGRYIFYKKGCSSMDPPSSTNELCNIFHKKIQELKYVILFAILENFDITFLEIRLIMTR